MSVARYLMAPLWLAQLATGAKSFCDNPLIGSSALNARGLHAARVKLSHRIAESRRRRLTHLIDPADRAAFDRDGFVEKRDFLPAELFARLRDATLAYRGPAREMVQGDAITRRIPVDPAALTISGMRDLIRDPRWRGLARYVASFDSEPLVYIQTILARRHEGPPDPQTEFHADTFHPTMKAWLFLTDVTEEDGPLAYVPGSHRLTPQRIAWEKAMSLVAADSGDRLSSRGSFRVGAGALPRLGLPPPRRFAVPANTLVVADTFGFHARVQAARPSTRIEIWAYGRRSPFLPWTGLDPLAMPGLAERRVPWLWAGRDRLARFIGQPWRDVGAKRPGDE